MIDSTLNQTNSTLERVLQLATQRTDAAEVYYLSSQDTPIEFENNRLKTLQTKALQGIALRVICQGKLGFASSTDLTRLNDLVDAAVQTAQIGDPAEFEFAADLRRTASESDYTSPDTQALVDVGDRLIEQVHRYNPEILVDLSFHTRSSRVVILTNRDVYAERVNQTNSASLSGNLVRGEDFLQAYTYDVARDAFPDCDRLLEQLLQKYQWAENTVSVESGAFPVLFTPRAAARTLASLFDSVLSGQAVVQKASPLADKLGQVLFDPRLTVFEDPSQGPGRCEFDDEGTPTIRKTLIDQGQVAGFYWDRRWAARASKEQFSSPSSSTGNGFRGGLSRPGPDLVNLCIAPGETSYADLIASMQSGLIVDQVLGAGQSNRLAGEFSVNLDLGYKVEQGQIVGRVKNTMVAGSIFEAFQQLIDFSDQAEWVGGGAYIPGLLFEQLGVVARR